MFGLRGKNINRVLSNALDTTNETIKQLANVVKLSTEELPQTNDEKIEFIVSRIAVITKELGVDKIEINNLTKSIDYSKLLIGDQSFLDMTYDLLKGFCDMTGIEFKAKIEKGE